MVDIASRFGPRANRKYFDILHSLRISIYSCSTPTAIARTLQIDKGLMSRYLSGVVQMPLGVYSAILCELELAKATSKISPAPSGSLGPGQLNLFSDSGNKAQSAFQSIGTGSVEQSQSFATLGDSSGMRALDKQPLQDATATSPVKDPCGLSLDSSELVGCSPDCHGDCSFCAIC